VSSKNKQQRTAAGAVASCDASHGRVTTRCTMSSKYLCTAGGRKLRRLHSAWYVVAFFASSISETPLPCVAVAQCCEPEALASAAPPPAAATPAKLKRSRHRRTHHACTGSSRTQLKSSRDMSVLVRKDMYAAAVARLCFRVAMTTDVREAAMMTASRAFISASRCRNILVMAVLTSARSWVECNAAAGEASQMCRHRMRWSANGTLLHHQHLLPVARVVLRCAHLVMPSSGQAYVCICNGASRSRDKERRERTEQKRRRPSQRAGCGGLQWCGLRATAPGQCPRPLQAAVPAEWRSVAGSASSARHRHIGSSPCTLSSRRATRHLRKVCR
jgi:hypothetical protein